LVLQAGVATTIVVVSAADSGPGTLRQAMLDADSGDTITFDPAVFPPGSPVTIAVTSELPEIGQGDLTIDGSNAGVILEGSSTPHGTDGFYIESSGNTIKGLQILNFPSDGVEISDGSYRNNTIGGDSGVGSGPTGEGNVLSGNSDDGVEIHGTGAESNIVIGNLIGTDVSGTIAHGNGGTGVRISAGAQQNKVGGTREGERNLISGHGHHGVEISGSGTISNTVSGNYIGTDTSGTIPLPNGDRGVYIVDGASHNVIGGDTPGERNLISGNGRHGVHIEWDGTDSNVVIGNYIGTDVNGTATLPNQENGIEIDDGACYNVIGGDTPGERNLISGNAQHGVLLSDYVMYNTIGGNYIGTDINGTFALPNGGNGVSISDGYAATHNLIGGETPGERNLISGNGHHGVEVSGSGTMSNTVSGNYIGTDASGTLALPNGGDGVSIESGSSGNLLGPSNVVAYNHGHGIGVYNPDSLHNTFTQNSIHSNDGKGIELEDGGNGELEVPIITYLDLGVGIVAGTACPYCRVEVFSDDEDEGQIYEGYTDAGGSGVFIFSKGSALTGPNVTTTATDADGNTSEFSPPP